MTATTPTLGKDRAALRECWVNVYETGEFPCWHSSPHESSEKADQANAGAVYRIHGRLKAPPAPVGAGRSV